MRIKGYFMAKNSFVAEVTFKVSHHPAKFGCHKHCGSGDVMIQNFRIVTGSRKNT